MRQREEMRKKAAVYTNLKQTLQKRSYVGQWWEKCQPVYKKDMWMSL